MMVISWGKKCQNRRQVWRKLRIPFPNRTGSYPGILSVSRAQESSWQYLLLGTVMLHKKGRWVPLTVACEEAHCEKSRVSGTRKEMWEWGRASVVARQSNSKWSRACSQAKHTGSNSPERWNCSYAPSCNHWESLMITYRTSGNFCVEP